MLIYLIVFIEGFCSLGAEIIALRRLVPHVGSSIVVTAPTIGFFLFVALQRRFKISPPLFRRDATAGYPPRGPA